MDGRMDCWVLHSDDLGQTWSKPRNITTSVWSKYYFPILSVLVQARVCLCVRVSVCMYACMYVSFSYGKEAIEKYNEYSVSVRQKVN